MKKIDETLISTGYHQVSTILFELYGNLFKFEHSVGNCWDHTNVFLFNSNNGWVKILSDFNFGQPDMMLYSNLGTDGGTELIAAVTKKRLLTTDTILKELFKRNLINNQK
jgi:hypothetical protein